MIKELDILAWERDVPLRFALRDYIEGDGIWALAAGVDGLCNDAEPPLARRLTIRGCPPDVHFDAEIDTLLIQSIDPERPDNVQPSVTSVRPSVHGDGLVDGGGSWQAMHEVLSYGFGVRTPFTLVWDNADVARRHLTRQPSQLGRRPLTFDELLETLVKHHVDVILRCFNPAISIR